MSVAPVHSGRLLALAGVRHAFFTRQGGVSQGLYASLNVGRGSRDDPAAVEENRARAARWFGLEPEALKVNYQVHGTAISLYEDETALEGDRRGDPPSEADGVMSVLPGVICGVLSADCAPVLLADPVAKVVCAVHAGWKGALAGVVEMALTVMIQDGGSKIEDIVGAVGPCIAPASYEVGEDFRQTFAEQAPAAAARFAARETPGKWSFDLPGFVLDRLEDAGVTRCEALRLDTCADEARFFSNRRALLRGEPDYGRLLSAIALT